MDIKQSVPEGVYLGISNKGKIVKLDSNKEHQSYNAIIMDEAGRGMSFIHKAALVSELNQNVKRVF